MSHRFFSTVGRMLTILVVCTASFTTKLSAQTTIGRQIVDQYPTTAWGTPTYGLTWLPSDYSSTTTKYPLIIFLHGSGEGGDGVSGLYNLIKYGLPMMISQGMNPEADNPSDGQHYKFIVVSPQAPSAAHWSYSWGQLQYILPDVLNRYRVDASRVYVTGISAGGAGTWSCTLNGQTVASKFAAIVPVSAAGTNSQTEADQLPFVGGTYGMKVWNICGANDAWLSFATNATNTINNATPAPQVPALLTAIPGVGHEPAAWNTPYDVNWRTNAQNLNIYEWMLKWKRDGLASSTTNIINQLPSANAGSSQTITLPASSVTLSGSGTDPDGTIASYKWSELTGPSNANILSASSASTSVSGLVQGVYTFQLTVTDNGGASASNNISVTVNAATPTNTTTTTTTTSSSTLHIEAENYSAMSGIQTENTGDVGGGKNVGYQDVGDWMDYPVNIASAGTYTVSFRVASMKGGPQFQLRKSDGSVLATLTVPSTGGYQTYQTITASVSLPAGQQTLRIVTTSTPDGWNINWWDIQGASSAVAAASKQSATEIMASTANPLELFPNPVSDRFSLKLDNQLSGKLLVIITNTAGQVVKQFTLAKPSNGSTQWYLSLAGLSKGHYFLTASMNQWKQTVKFIKE